MAPFACRTLAFRSFLQQLFLQAMHCLSEPTSPRSRTSPYHLKTIQSLGQGFLFIAHQSQPDEGNITFTLNSMWVKYIKKKENLQATTLYRIFFFLLCGVLCTCQQLTRCAKGVLQALKIISTLSMYFIGKWLTLHGACVFPGLILCGLLSVPVFSARTSEL